MENAGSITIGAKIETKQFDKQIDYIENRLEEIEYQLKRADMGFEVGDTQKLEQEYEKLSNRLIDLQKQKEKVSETPIDDGGVSTKRFGEGIEKISKKIARIGLAMLGIRGLFGMVSSSVSRIASANPELQAQIDGIRSKIDNVVMKLVDLVLPVISIITDLVGKILKGLFGIDISSGNFSKNMTTANKSATKLRKQLMGFDEMNILNKDGSIGGLGTGSSSGTGGGNTNTKDYGFYNDMSDLNKGLADLGVVAVYTGDDLKETRLELEQLIADVKLGNATMNEKNGIVTIMNKAGNSIQFTKQEYEKLLDDINHSRVTSRNLDIWWKVRETFTNWNLNVMLKYHKKIEKLAQGDFSDWNEEIENAKTNFVKNMDGATFSFKNGMYEMKMTNGEIVRLTKDEWEQLKPYMQYLGLNIVKNANDTGGKIQLKSAETTSNIKSNWFKTINEITNMTPEIAQAVLDGNYQIKKDYVEVKTASGEVVKYSIDEFKKMQKSLTSVGEAGKTSANDTKKNWLTSINEIIDKLNGDDENSLVNTAIDVFNTIANYPPSEKEKKNMFSGIQSAIDNLNKNPFKVTIQAVLDTTGMMKTLKNLAKSWPSMFQPIVTSLEKQGYHASKGAIINPPRLAKGGIINRPGRGVPLAVGGEISKEGIIPMDNQASMELLGRSIAKYISINLTNVTELDGRQIALTTAKVMNEMNFASNGGVM